MADTNTHTITIPFNSPTGSTIPITIKIPKDKLQVGPDGKATGGDQEYIEKALQQAVEQKYPTAVGLPPRVNAPGRNRPDSLRGDPSAADDFATQHPVLSGISTILGAPFRSMLNRQAESPEFTEQNTAPEDIAWKRGTQGLGDTIGNAFDLFMAPGLIKGIRKPSDLWPLAKSVAGYEAGSRGTEYLGDKLGFDPTVSRLLGQVVGAGTGTVAAGGSPRINDAVKRGKAAAANTDVSSNAVKVGAGVGSTAGAWASKKMGIPAYGGMAGGAAVGGLVGGAASKTPAFLRGVSQAQGPWIDPAITGFLQHEPPTPAPTPFFPGQYPGPNVPTASERLALPQYTQEFTTGPITPQGPDRTIPQERQIPPVTQPQQQPVQQPNLGYQGYPPQQQQTAPLGIEGPRPTTNPQPIVQPGVAPVNVLPSSNTVHEMPQAIVDPYNSPIPEPRVSPTVQRPKLWQEAQQEQRGSTFVPEPKVSLEDIIAETEQRQAAPEVITPPKPTVKPPVKNPAQAKSATTEQQPVKPPAKVTPVKVTPPVKKDATVGPKVEPKVEEQPKVEQQPKPTEPVEPEKQPEPATEEAAKTETTEEAPKDPPEVVAEAKKLVDGGMSWDTALVRARYNANARASRAALSGPTSAQTEQTQAPKTEDKVIPRSETIPEVEDSKLLDYIQKRASGVTVGDIQGAFGLTAEQAAAKLDALKGSNQLHRVVSRYKFGENPKATKETVATVQTEQPATDKGTRKVKSPKQAEFDALEKKDKTGELTDEEETRWLKLSKELAAEKKGAKTTATTEKPVVNAPNEDKQIAGFKSTFKKLSALDPDRMSDLQSKRLTELTDLLYKGGKERTASEIKAKYAELEAQKASNATNEVRSREQPEQQEIKPKESENTQTIAGFTPAHKRMDHVLSLADPTWEPGKQVSRAHLVAIRDAYDLPVGPVARHLMKLGYNVERSLMPTGYGENRSTKGGLQADEDAALFEKRYDNLVKAGKIRRDE